MTTEEDLAANTHQVSQPATRAKARRKRYGAILLIVTLMALLGLSRLKSWHSNRLNDAILMVEDRKYRDALPVLQRLDRFAITKNEQRDFLLGLCLERTGRRDLAIERWKELRPGTRFFDDATLKVAEWYEDEGRLEDAERLYRAALEASGPMRTEIRHALMQLYWLEGRLEEARALIRANLLENDRKHGPGDSRTIAVLRAHLTLDLEIYPVEHVRKRIEAAAARAPRDRGVALGRAYLAMRTGQAEEARTILESLTHDAPADPAVAVARFQEALDRGEWRVVNESRRLFDPDLIQPGLAARGAAMVAAGRGDDGLATKILETCLERNPGEFAVIDRLAEAYISAGAREKAARLRTARQKLDQDRREYANRVGTDFRVEAAMMADLAERIGRYFEAAGFARMLLGKAPVDPKRLERVRRLMESDEAARTNGTYWEMADAAVPRTVPAESGPAGDPAKTSGPIVAIPRFEDIAEPAGIRFVFESGRSPRRQLPETMSGGVGLIDYDGDERLDIYVVQGGAFPFDAATAGEAQGDRLFRNLGEGKFEDVTVRAGLPDRRVGYGHGVTVGDIDNDGHPDLFVTRYGSYALYRNLGDGKFEDVTTAWGLSGDRDWPSSAAFADLDNDGDLDLYVCHYVVWNSSDPRHCSTESGGPPAYCVPHLLTARPDHLFRNDGNRFVDISDEAGITGADTEGRGLGVVAADLDDDGLVDLYVANDGTADFLFRNLGGMKFEEIGVLAGVAANSDGGYQAGMGTGFGDFDADGKFDLSVTNFYGESTSLFQNLGGALFRERGASIGLKEATRYRLGFGTVMADLNDDGFMDTFTANGHVNDVRPVIPYDMPCQILLGTASGRVYDATARAGEAVNQLRLGRGLAVGDLDTDGRLDLVQLSLDSPLAIFRNVPEGASGQEGHFVGFRLIGTKSNRDGVGARVTIRSGDFVRHSYRYGGGSYQSANSPRLHFGLGAVAELDEVVVRWPSGQVDRHANLAAGRYYLLKEGGGVAEPIEAKSKSTNDGAPKAPGGGSEGADQ